MMMVPSSPPPSVLPSFFGTRRRRGGGGGGWIMTDVSILVMVALSFVFQFSDATIGTRTAEEDFTWKYNGEVNIGVLVNLHHSQGVGGCGTINIDAIQQVVAAKWAIDVINNQSLPHELQIGLQVHDTCNSEELTQKHLYNIISTTREAASVLNLKRPAGPPLLGMIGIGEPATLTETTGALHAFNIPLISVTPHPTGPSYSNVLTTAPDMAGQARALANLAYEMNAKRIALISSSRTTVHTFLEEATALGIRVPHILDLSQKALEMPQQVEKFIRQLPGKRPVVAVIVEAVEAVAVAEHLKHIKMESDPLWLVGSLGLDLHKLSAWRQVFHGGLFVEPHMPELAEFKSYFIDALQSNEDKLSELIYEYKEEMFGCSKIANPSSPKQMTCDAVPSHEIELRFQQDAQVSFVVKAVSALTAAFRLVQLDHCSESVLAACLRVVHPDLHESILTNLRKLSFTSMGSSPTEVKGTQHHFTRNGRLVANKQLVFQIDQDVGMESIGWYSEDEGLHLSLALDDSVGDLPEIDVFSEPVSSPLVNSIPVNDRSIHGRAFEQNQNDLVTAIVSSSSEEEEAPLQARDDNSVDANDRRNKMPVFSYEAFISRTWSIVVLSVAIGGTCVALFMFTYVLIKMCDGTLTGNQTMGLILLVGVTGLFASVVPWLLPPNETICTIRHFLHPLIMVLCFAILLVKAMQLRSLVSVGLGGTIPQVNQVFSLIFMILVQVVIAVEWYVTSQPFKIVLNEGYPECGVSQHRFLLLHVYPFSLVMLAFFYGLTVLKIKRNFNEGRWITIACITIGPIFVAWFLVYYFAPVHFHDASVAVSIVAMAGTLLTAIFLPKMHTIAHQSKLKNLDLYRSHSDSTVFTGFSDFIAPFPPSKKHQKYYPVYGYSNPYVIPPPYTTNNPGRPQPVYHSPIHPRPTVVGGPPTFVPAGPPPPPHHMNFNGLNYVSSHQKRGPRLTAYTDWSHNGRVEMPTSSSRGRSRRRRHSSSPNRNEVTTTPVVKSPRSKSSHKGSEIEVTHTTSRGRPRRRSISNTVTSAATASVNPHQQHQTNPQHFLRIHTHSNEVNVGTTDTSLVSSTTRQHSSSPSDGMILTAAGLRDTISSEHKYEENSNVVILGDGLNDMTNDSNVYLATS